MRPLRILPAAVAAMVTAVSAYGIEIDLLRQRAAEGDREAMYRLAWIYDTGTDSIAPDTALSTELYQRSADLGFAPAQNYLGFRYYTGQGVERDTVKGLELITRAADEGYAPAINNLAWLLIDDIRNGGTRLQADTIKAISLLTTATNNRVPDAAQTLSHLLTDTPAAAFTDSVTADAFAALGRAYSFGAGVPYNHERSLALYLHAARLGQPDARRIIAETLEILPDALSAPNQFINPPVTPEETSPLHWQ